MFLCPKWSAPYSIFLPASSCILVLCRPPYTLKIDILYREGLYLQKVMRFFQLIFGPKNIPQVEQNNSGHIEEV
jgi:hypothetical protein